MTMGMLGRKLGMTQLFNEEGKAIPVTIVEAGPCPVVAHKSPEKDGYSAVQLGFEEKRPHKVNKSEKGTFEKVGVTPHEVSSGIPGGRYRGLSRREFRYGGTFRGR